MKKRINNDIRIKWMLFDKNDNPINLNAAQVDFRVIHETSRRSFIPVFITNENVIESHFLAASQFKTGKYSLYCCIKFPDPSIQGGIGTYTIDTDNVFELVDKTALEDKNDLLEITSNIEITVGCQSGDGLTETQKEWIGEGTTITNGATSLPEGINKNSEELEKKAPKDHNHDSVYAPKNHTHAGFASESHNHDLVYSAKEHKHDSLYAPKTHGHDDKLDKPATSGSVGQVLTITENGHEWKTPGTDGPSPGTDGLTEEQKAFLGASVDLQTEAKDSLPSAINEVAGKVESLGQEMGNISTQDVADVWTNKIDVRAGYFYNVSNGGFNPDMGGNWMANVPTKVTPGKTYTIRGIHTTYPNVHGFATLPSKGTARTEEINSILNTDGTRTVIIPAGINYIGAIFQSGIDPFNCRIVEGEVYIDDYFKPKIKNNIQVGWDSLNDTQLGKIKPVINFEQKNKVDSNNIIQGYINPGTGNNLPIINKNTVAGGADKYLCFIYDLDVRCKYTLSGNQGTATLYKSLLFIDQLGNIIGYSCASKSQNNYNCEVIWDGTNFTIQSMPDKTHSICIQLQGITDIKTAEIQFEEGESVTEYEERRQYDILIERKSFEKEKERVNNELLNLSNSIANAKTVPSRWSGKQYMVIGDSISSHGYTATKLYCCWIAELVGCIENNKAASGQTMATHAGNTNNWTYSTGKYNSHNYSSYDIITIALGTNDYGFNVPIGSDYNSVDVSTFIGAYNVALNQIFAGNKLARVVLITPFKRVQMSANTAGHTLQDYVDAIIKIGEKWGCPVIDAYRNAGINSVNLNTMTYDGLHLGDVGHKFVGEYFASVIKAL